jgi:hypothetical protein
MKTLLIIIVAFISTAQASEPIRDLNKFPLTVNEAKAYTAAKKLAASVSQIIRDVCVNASFKPGSGPVTVQFYRLDEEGESCIDPHYSIEVEFEAGNVVGIKLNDA